MSTKRKVFSTKEEAEKFIKEHNFENCDIQLKKGKYYLIQKSKAIFGNYFYEDSGKKGVIMYEKGMTFEKMIGWVYRNCTGCEKIEILPNLPIPEVIAYFLDRVEVYTVEDYDISNNLAI